MKRIEFEVRNKIGVVCSAFVLFSDILPHAGNVIVHEGFCYTVEEIVINSKERRCKVILTLIQNEN